MDRAENLDRSEGEPPAVATSGQVVARNFLALGSGELIARGLAFAASIYMARALGVEMYGVLGFATAVLLYFMRIADGGLDLVGMREIAADHAAATRVVPSVFVFRILLAVTLVILLGGVALLWLPRPDGPVLALYALTLIPIGLSTRWVHLGLERGGRAAAARVVEAGAVLLGIVLLVHGPGDVLAVPLAHLAGGMLGAVLLLAWLGPHRVPLAPRLDWPTLRPLLRRTWPMVAAALLGLLIYNSDLILLRLIRGPTVAGYYAAAYIPVSLPVNLGLAYRVSLLPTLTRVVDSRTKRLELYHTATAHMFAAGFPIAVGGSLLAPKLMTSVFGASYEPAAGPLQLLIWSVPLCLLRDIPLVALMAAGRESRVLRLTAWATALNLLLNALLIPAYGMYGGAAATVMTEGARMVTAAAAARDEGWALAGASRYWRSAGASAVMAAVLLLAVPAPIWLSIPLGALAYVGALAALGGISFRAGALPTLNV
ncbi:MAG: flippase [Gemmatimonadaceae bacterium]